MTVHCIVARALSASPAFLQLASGILLHYFEVCCSFSVGKTTLQALFKIIFAGAPNL